MASATFSTSLEAQQAAALLENYHFELGHHDARQWVSLWLEFYRPSWIREAVIEALYQGRYKSVSVRQILELWQRREQPIRHASHEFEAAVCREFENAKALPNEVTTLPHMQRRRSVASRSIKKTRRLPVDKVSFNLSALPPMPAEMLLEMPEEEMPKKQPEQPFAGGQPAKNESLSALAAAANGSEPDPMSLINRPFSLDNKAWRQFPAYAPVYSAPSASEVINAQAELNGNGSERAIQPFKPALPFSPQTLQLAKQKTLA
ncbi:MAG: hypothetical protein DCF15_14400 [Phormidesmis priestleyi]|uniref:Uncharacterized protein n=1 Tax=Phormidesmis priestleyi TaxID=268141 RepID=A0A2W4X3P0_9CYAN|nr:MAG: hypothetical protein DCF15_14400 [Phormidesmis priestleyi]